MIFNIDFSESMASATVYITALYLAEISGLFLLQRHKTFIRVSVPLPHAQQSVSLSGFLGS